MRARRRFFIVGAVCRMGAPAACLSLSPLIARRAFTRTTDRAHSLSLSLNHHHHHQLPALPSQRWRLWPLCLNKKVTPKAKMAAEPPPTTECVSQSGDGWFVEVTPDTLDVARFTAMVTAANCGAVAAFVGTTRDHFDCRRVVRLEYEAYGPMALRKMQVSERRGASRERRCARSIDRSID